MRHTSSPSITTDSFPKVRVGDDVHVSIEHDTSGNPVIVLIAPLELVENE